MTSDIYPIVIQCCMTNNLSSFKPILNSNMVEIDGTSKESFFQFFERTLNSAHKKYKGDWSMQIEPADWIKNRDAMVYDFYERNNKKPIISVVLEQTGTKVWIDVLK